MWFITAWPENMRFFSPKKLFGWYGRFLLSHVFEKLIFQFFPGRISKKLIQLQWRKNGYSRNRLVLHNKSWPTLDFLDTLKRQKVELSTIHIYGNTSYFENSVAKVASSRLKKIRRVFVPQCYYAARIRVSLNVSSTTFKTYSSNARIQMMRDEYFFFVLFVK